MYLHFKMSVRIKTEIHTLFSMKPRQAKYILAEYFNHEHFFYLDHLQCYTRDCNVDDLFLKGNALKIFTPFK